MKCKIRRVGNSLGILLPRSALAAWGVGEGDSLQLTDRAIRPPSPTGLSHEQLDELKRNIALAVVRLFTSAQIRAQILANLHRWQSRGSWVSAYDQWLRIAQNNDDGALYAAMLGRDNEAKRLRQSMPFVGLLPANEVRKLREEATA